MNTFTAFSARALSGCAMGVLLLLAAPAAWACKPNCMTGGSVVHAAGMPPELAALLQQVVFQGPGLAPADAAVLKKMAAVLAKMPATAVVTLHTAGDDGLAANLAYRQAASRANAVQKALRAQLQALGAPASRVQVSARPGT